MSLLVRDGLHPTACQFVATQFLAEKYPWPPGVRAVRSGHIFEHLTYPICVIHNEDWVLIGFKGYSFVVPNSEFMRDYFITTTVH